jgi:hypothetical protein
VTRRDAAKVLAELFAPFGIPVVASPADPVIAPALVVGPGSPYRATGTACWEQTFTVTLLAGRADDVDVYDRLDDLADTLCAMHLGNGLVNRGASGAPEVRPVGDVDMVLVEFTVTAYNLGPGLVI